WKRVETYIDSRQVNERHNLEEEISHLKEHLESEQKNSQLSKELQNKKRLLDNTLTDNSVDEAAIRLIHSHTLEHEQFVKESALIVESDHKKIAKNTKNEIIEEIIEEQPPLEKVVQSIDRVTEAVAQLPGFKSILND